LSNPIVAFNDSPTGVVLATVLHTLGAIAFLGGLVGYLAWHRQLVHGHANRKVLETSNVLAYVAILVNLLGGFMRTFESDHPTLEQFGQSPWVRAIAIKHVFLFAAMGATVYLFERMAPRLLAAHREDRLTDASPLGHRVAVVVAGLGIVVAAVLGALTLVVPELSAQAGGEEHDHLATGAVHYLNATGQLTSTPLAPSTGSGGFDLGDATTSLEATFTWTPAQFALSTDITGPSGQRVALSGANGQAQATLVAPQAGPWTYAVRADAAAGVTWTLALKVQEAPTTGSFQSAHATIAPGTFVELNLDVGKDEPVHWAWSASASIHFEPHSHFDGTEQEIGPKDAAQDEGHLVAERAGTYSLLWENKGSSPVSLDYRVWGDFAVLAE
jgi:hypothetical protein